MELLQYSKAALRWWWLIVISTGIAAAVSYYATSQLPRVYRASTTLMVGQVTQKTNPNNIDFFIAERLGQSYAQIAVRRPVLQATIESLGLSFGWQSLRGRVSVQQIPGTQLLVVYVLDNSPELARVISDEIAHQLILKSPNSPENQQRLQRSSFVQDQLDDLEQRIQTTQTRVQELEAELATALSATKIRDLQTEIAGLEGLINTWQGNYAELLNFIEGSDSPNYLSVIEPAQLPRGPISPNVRQNVLLAAGVVFALAVGTAFLLEYIDKTIKSPNDLSESLGLTVLGRIGKVADKDLKHTQLTSGHTFSPVAEDFRKMRSNIKSLAIDRRCKSILFTSPGPGVGKSFIAANTAVSMAQVGLRTVIIDGDLRRPSIHEIFDLSNVTGLTDLCHSSELERIHGELKDTEIENLMAITSGPLPPNPSELLESSQLTQLLKSLQDMFDVVVVDSPPVLVVTDAVVLSSKVDGVILVTRAGRTRRDMAREAIDSLEQVEANILGGVLNGVSGKQQSYYYSYHYYGSNGHSADSQLVRAKQHQGKRRFTFMKK